MASATGKPHWDVGVEGPVRARRKGVESLRSGMPFDIGRVVALDGEGLRVGYQTFEVFPDRKVVLLVEADTGPFANEMGVDNRGKGVGGAMLDELDRRYPEPDWLMGSSDGHLHSQDGIDFMRHRSASGKRKIHTEDCAMERPVSCSCDFTDVGDEAPLGSWT